MKNILPVLLLSLASSPLLAAPVTYDIDATHTFANFEWDHFGFAHHGAKIPAAGTVTLDLEKKTGSVDVTMALKEVDSGVEKLDEHLQSKDFFEADKYPLITFKSTQLKFDGKVLHAVIGDLTVHGVTKPVKLTVTRFVCKDHPMKKDPACGAEAVGTLKRSDFGVAAYVPAVSDEIRLRIDVEAQQK